MRHATPIATGSVAGVVSAVPRTVWSNAEIQGAAEVARMTGVETRRRVVTPTNTEDLCVAAASRLLERLEWWADDISLLVYVTQVPEQPIPAPVYTIHKRLGLSSACLCVQINWACAGYVNGLYTALRLCEGRGKALLLVGDAISMTLDMHDRATAPLFGDAGSATAIVGDGPMHSFIFGSDGTGVPHLSQHHGKHLHMDGAAVYDFTLQRVPALVGDTLALGEPDLLLFHQANKFMLQYLLKKSGLGPFPSPRIPMNIDRYGNCSCASIPVLMCDKASEQVLGGARVAMFGFGAGWAWGSALMDMREVKVCELIEMGPL